MSLNDLKMLIDYIESISKNDLIFQKGVDSLSEDDVMFQKTFAKLRFCADQVQLKWIYQSANEELFVTLKFDETIKKLYAMIEAMKLCDKKDWTYLTVPTEYENFSKIINDLYNNVKATTLQQRNKKEIINEKKTNFDNFKTLMDDIESLIKSYSIKSSTKGYLLKKDFLAWNSFTFANISLHHLVVSSAVNEEFLTTLKFDKTLKKLYDIIEDVKLSDKEDWTEQRLRKECDNFSKIVSDLCKRILRLDKKSELKRY